jgi:copper chaperone
MTETRNTMFRVPDMSCGHCAATIREALEKRMPDAHVDIDVTTSRVTVTGDEKIAAAAIREAGYTPEQIQQL